VGEDGHVAALPAQASDSPAVNESDSAPALIVSSVTLEVGESRTGAYCAFYAFCASHEALTSGSAFNWRCFIGEAWEPQKRRVPTPPIPREG
jgi:hypothetical protein